jgi:D-sedoheptulose 7-phosphate isomerase
MAMRKSRARGGPFERGARAILREAERVVRRTARLAPPAVAAGAECLVASLESGGTIYFCGNGGSAADAQHLSTELSGRFLMERAALPAMALTTNTSALTAIGNDYGYRYVFSRQLEGMGTPGDVLVAITTSGRSPNVIEAVRTARRMGMAVVGITGPKGKAFARMCDVALVTPGASTSPYIQAGHLVMGHAMCELVERAIFTKPGRSGAGPSRRSMRRARPRRGTKARR